MGLSLELGEVADELPALDAVAGDPRMRPIGLVGGCLLVLLGVLLQVAGGSEFWNTVVAGVLVFVGIPLFAMGLAAPEPEGKLFRLGVDFTDKQRHVVALGSLVVIASPIVVAVLGTAAGFADWVWLVGAGLALAGAALILTGFIAWTSSAVAEPSSPSR
jgi:hypothetical protein